MAVTGLTVAGKRVPVPAYFPSVSSVKANAPPSEYVQILAAAGERHFLVSAYDMAAPNKIEHEAMREALAKAQDGGATILLDSGNYESFWKSDARWSAESYAEVLASTDAPLVFCFDNQQPVSDSHQAANAIEEAVMREQLVASTATVCPIVHATPEELPVVVRLVAAQLHPILLAVAERELGDGILARAASIRQLREILDEVAPETSLHILGTGSPTAILIYAMAGAQSFDGLEWCRTCVDPDTARLLHFQHRDLVRTLEPSVVSSLPYQVGTLLHNLFFYRIWMARIQDCLATGTADALLDIAIPTSARDRVRAAMRSR